MIIPGRSCVALISRAPDAYGIVRQAVRVGCNLDSRSLGGVSKNAEAKILRPQA
jgi:hypothetical protein